MSTGIQWTDETWNCVTGCSKVSPGCAHCYAEGVALRFWPTQYPPVAVEVPIGDCTVKGDANIVRRPRQFTDVQCHEDRLDQPLRWKKPRKVFVNSMSDLFHEDVPDAFIDRVFAVMVLARWHIFQVLTKRAARMREYANGGWQRRVAEVIKARGGNYAIGSAWYPENVWLGVSVENQRFAAERIPLLLQTPAAIRFISAEPLLGPVDLSDLSVGDAPDSLDALSGETCSSETTCVVAEGPALDWVIVGGESGTGARPFDVAWARAIVQQCKAAGVACFVKQLGSDPRDAGAERDDIAAREAWPAGWTPTLAGRRVWRPDLTSRKGGDPAEWPEDLRVRAFPVTSCP